MKPFLIFLVLSLLFFSSCGRDVICTLSNVHDSQVLVAEDKGVMEGMIDCAFTRDCDHRSVMGLLPSQKVFLVEPGTRVMVSSGFTFSSARKIHLLEGPYSGREGWVYGRMLSGDPGSVPFQQAFARLGSDR